MILLKQLNFSKLDAAENTKIAVHACNLPTDYFKSQKKASYWTHRQIINNLTAMKIMKWDLVQRIHDRSLGTSLADSAFSTIENAYLLKVLPASRLASGTCSHFPVKLMERSLDLGDLDFRFLHVDSAIKLPKLDLNTSPLTSVENSFYNDVVEGLSQPQKRLSCKYFYDERGSHLFDEICKLDEYYLTRTELDIMDRYLEEMAYQIGPRAVLVEFGSGSSTKTRILLGALENPVGYVPIDISEEHLLSTAEDLRMAFPYMQIMPVVADFTQGFELPTPGSTYSHAALFFPGSTIGNFTPSKAIEMMRSMAQILGPQGGMLIGLDLQKDPTTLEAAYNDAMGVTAEFNLNLLHRINRELGGDFNVEQFRHQAIYNEELGRIEMYIISTAKQSVTIRDHVFDFAAEERIFTESSHKYTTDGFSEMAAKAGFTTRKYWTDSKKMFAIMHLVRLGP